jgi:hypothetical protein
MSKKSSSNGKCGIELLPRGTKCRAGCKIRILDLQDGIMGPRSSQSLVLELPVVYYIIEESECLHHFREYLHIV